MLSVDPTMRYNAVKLALQGTGDHPTPTAGDIACSGTGAEPWPNHAYGYSRVNAGNAVNATLAQKTMYYF